MSKLHHYTDHFLDQMRQQTDPLADQAVADLMCEENSIQYKKILQTLTNNDYSLPAGLPKSVVHFFEESRQLPPWVDEKLMRQGQQFYERNISSLVLMLGLLSLPFDYAAANGAQVLYMSERLRYQPAKRLAETSQYLLDVGERGGFSPKGKAICSAQKVRLTHAAIRYHIAQRNDWNQSWGEPINQEDMAGTNLSFSLIPIRGMRKVGIEVTPDEAQAYIHLWNVASYIMGVDERLLPDTTKDAFWLIKQIQRRQHQPSEAGQHLTKSLLEVLPTNDSFDTKEIAIHYMRFLLGDDVADILNLPPSVLPRQWLAAPIIGFNQLRQQLSNRVQQYYSIRQQLMRQQKQWKAQPFTVPPSLKPT